MVFGRFVYLVVWIGGRFILLGRLGLRLVWISVFRCFRWFF